jgi:hypothetical protein
MLLLALPIQRLLPPYEAGRAMLLPFLFLCSYFYTLAIRLRRPPGRGEADAHPMAVTDHRRSHASWVDRGSGNGIDEDDDPTVPVRDEEYSTSRQER